MRTISRLAAASAAVLVAAPALTSCASTAAGTGDGEAVVVQYNPTAYSWLGVVAEEQGFFDKHGVDAELKQIDNGTLATTALAGGDITLAFQDLSLVSAYLNKGQDFTAVTATGRLSWDIVAPKGSSSTAFPESVRALEGKKVGVPALGSVAYYYARAYLNAAGVDPDSVQYVAVGPFAQVPAVIETGQVDAAVVTPDQTYQLQQTTGVDVLFEARKDKAKVGDSLASVVDTPGSFYFAQTEWTERNPETVQDVQAALVETDEWIHDADNREELAALLNERGLLPKSLEGEQARLDFVAYASELIGSGATADQVQAYVDFWKSNGVLEADTSGERLLSDTAPAPTTTK